MRARNKRENVLQSQQCYRHSGIAGSSVITEKKLSCRSFFLPISIKSERQSRFTNGGKNGKDNFGIITFFGQKK